MIAMNEICMKCEKWENSKRKILENSESIFDAHQDMIEFEEQCIKTCPYSKINLENS